MVFIPWYGPKELHYTKDKVVFMIDDITGWYPSRPVMYSFMSNGVVGLPWFLSLTGGK